MSKHDWIRFWLHFPIGLLAGWISLFYPIIGLTFFLGFLTYEAMNDWRKWDWSYKDVLGGVAGYPVIPLLISLRFIWS